MQSLRMSASTSARPQQTMGDIPDQTEAEIMIGPHREASRLPTVKDAIAMTISARIVTSRIHTSIAHGSKG